MRGKNQGNVVMIADDDLFVRKVITAAIDGLADIVEVTDGAKVLEVYHKARPDILFLDIHLPNISGLELIRPLKKDDAGAFIIMTSSDSCADNIFKIKQRGARAFLAKPFDKARITNLFNKCPTVSFMDF